MIQPTLENETVTELKKLFNRIITKRIKSDSYNLSPYIFIINLDEYDILGSLEIPEDIYKKIIEIKNYFNNQI